MEISPGNRALLDMIASMQSGMKKQNEKIKQAALAQGFTPQELGETVMSTGWEISCECGEDEDPDGKTFYCVAKVEGHFRIRGNLIQFETRCPDFELEITDSEDEEEGAAELSEAQVEAIRDWVQASIYEKLDKEAESAKDGAKYEYADDQELKRVGVMAYHGVSWRDFI
jgi:hypothetical protein